MADLFLEHWVGVIFALITAGLTFFCKYLFNEVRKYRDLLEEHDKEEIIRIIDERMEPIMDAIKANNQLIEAYGEEHRKNLEAIKEYYKYSLINKCNVYLRKGYMTTFEYEDLSEFFKTYSSMGGNGQGEAYYVKASKLPIHDDE